MKLPHENFLRTPLLLSICPRPSAAKQWLEELAQKKEVLQYNAKQDLILISKKKF